MKKLVCGIFGTIYYAQILKNGLMSSTNRVDVTDDAIQAVLMHLTSQTEYHKESHFGYEFKLASGEKVRMIAYNPERYVLVEGRERNDLK